jgi:hypothetical protein
MCPAIHFHANQFFELEATGQQGQAEPTGIGPQVKNSQRPVPLQQSKIAGIHIRGQARQDAALVTAGIINDKLNLPATKGQQACLTEKQPLKSHNGPVVKVEVALEKFHHIVTFFDIYRIKPSNSKTRETAWFLSFWGTVFRGDG